MSNVIICDFKSVDMIRENIRVLGATKALEFFLENSDPSLEIFIRAVIKNTIKRWRRGEGHDQVQP